MFQSALHYLQQKLIGSDTPDNRDPAWRLRVNNNLPAPVGFCNTLFLVIPSHPPDILACPFHRKPETETRGKRGKETEKFIYSVFSFYPLPFSLLSCGFPQRLDPYQTEVTDVLTWPPTD
jgi:hypothetical protein